MPHVVLHTHSPLHELIEALAPFVVRDGDTVWRLRDVYLNPRETHALAECLIVQRGRQRPLFVQLGQRESDASVVVRPHAPANTTPQPSVKRMVALVAEAVRDAHPDVELGHTTIRAFLSDRYRHEPDPEIRGFDPLLDTAHLPRPVAWPHIFGTTGAVEIEIGSGKGTFLVEAARRDPDTGFVSIEYARAYAEHLRDRVRRHDLRNVRVVRDDAQRFIEERVPPSSVRVVHVYFPDPWPKKRHHKRRLIQPAFARAVADALETGGELRIVTDHAKYFAWATEVLDAEPRLEAIPVEEGEMEDLTNYERKYRAEGRTIHRARYRRVEAK